MIDFERLNKYVKTIEDLLLDVEFAIQDLEEAKLDLEEAKKEIGSVKETTGKILSYSAMSEEEKTNLVADIEDWKAGVEVKVGDKVKRGNIAYEVIQAHTTQSDWLPENVPALFKVFVPIKTASGEEVIADFKQPTGAHDAYNIGDKVMFEGQIYESVIDNNVYSPTAYPQGWKLVE